MIYQLFMKMTKHNKMFLLRVETIESLLNIGFMHTDLSGCTIGLSGLVWLAAIITIILKLAPE